MSLKMVNEELRIQSCSIEDLSLEIKESFVEQFKGDPIETLTLFYNSRTEMIILNQDNKDYELYELMAITYLEANEDKRKFIKENDPNSMIETLNLLDQTIKSREIELLKKRYQSEFKMIGNQTYFYNQKDMIEAIDIVDKYNSSFMKLVSSYNWGYIQGIRAERARRKKVSV